LSHVAEGLLKRFLHFYQIIIFSTITELSTAAVEVDQAAMQAAR
jgi:hypothetical protein